jgi:hypothetical protein
MISTKIRGFLLQKPKPHAVRVVVDGEEQDVELGRSYAKTAESIAALEPESIRCYNAGGSLLRAMNTDEAETHRSEAAAIPEGLKADPQALMLTHFANLLHRAYEHSTEIAFTKMVEVFDVMGARSESIESRLARAEAENKRLVNDVIDSEFERAEEIAERKGEGDGLGEQMLGAFLGGKVNLTPRPPAKTNGAGKNGAGKHPPAPKGD